MKTIAILSLVFMLACQPQQSMELSDQEITAVMEASNAYGSAIVAGDFEKLRTLMDPGMTIMPADDAPAHGIDASIEVMESFPDIEGTISPEQIEGSGNLAFVRGTFELTFIFNDSTQTSDVGKYVEIWKKIDDESWKLLVDIWNSDSAPEM